MLKLIILKAFMQYLDLCFILKFTYHLILNMLKTVYFTSRNRAKRVEFFLLNRLSISLDILTDNSSILWLIVLLQTDIINRVGNCRQKMNTHYTYIRYLNAPNNLLEFIYLHKNVLHLFRLDWNSI